MELENPQSHLVISGLMPPSDSSDHCPGRSVAIRQKTGEIVTKNLVLTPLLHGFLYLSSLKAGFCAEFFAKPMIPEDPWGGVG